MRIKRCFVSRCIGLSRVPVEQQAEHSATGGNCLMKMLLSLGIMTVLFVSFGCGNKSDLGGPGASNTATSRMSSYPPADTSSTTHTTGTAQTAHREGMGAHNRDILGKPKNDTFDLKAPSLATKIKQGESKQVTISVERSNDFKEDVTLKAMTSDKGLTISPSTATVKASDANTDVKFTVTVTKEAAVGEHAITVTASPSKGAPTSVSFKVDVTGT
jgi:hypothetical protein